MQPIAKRLGRTEKDVKGFRDEEPQGGPGKANRHERSPSPISRRNEGNAQECD